MNVASLELCKELYELSGWESELTWAANGSGLEFIVRSDNGELGHDIFRVAYAYPLGYLLRKLPAFKAEQHGPAELSMYELSIKWNQNKLKWFAGYSSGTRWELHTAVYDTPEDAACLLTIKLFEEGVLTNEAQS